MLVLSRRVDEEIVLGQNIRIRIVGIRGSQVRVAIDAPREIAIRRSELAAGESLAQPAARPETEEVVLDTPLLAS